MFSIIIPTWNNIAFLKLCIESIKANSSLDHQIVVHINEGSDGSLEWVRENNIGYSFTPKNEGVCIAVNMATKLATKDYILFMNDDMYVLPGWDKMLADEIKKLDTDCFMLSSTMIEPYNTRNKCVIVANYGRNTEDFKEKELLADFASLPKKDWSGSTWPPSVVHKKWWDFVGGYSEEFSPGMGSDDDFSIKMWQAGCRIYKGIGASRVYHFISKSTGRIVRNDGKKQFLQKWGIKQSTYHKYYLRRGEDYAGALSAPRFNPGFLMQKLVAVFKRL
ncbi:MAG: glycosyltransferase family 2 protein [Bacteroidota bacterium]|nr:glycosyltransferase family 2 protein [Bacteroidota bacterium]